MFIQIKTFEEWLEHRKKGNIYFDCLGKEPKHSIYPDTTCYTEISGILNWLKQGNFYYKLESGWYKTNSGIDEKKIVYLSDKKIFTIIESYAYEDFPFTLLSKVEV